jgi:moderate conductance mechanosensitive channel
MEEKMNDLLAVWKIGKNTEGRLVINLDWERLFEQGAEAIEYLINKLILIVVVLITAYLIRKISDKIINRFVERQSKSKSSLTMNKNKAMTVGAILKSTVKYAVYFSAAAIIISNIFRVSAAVLSGIGFVVGIGAQSLVKDLINGFFILFEDQFGVGDYITLGKFNGIVENIGIRSTVLKDFNGDIHTIPNGAITEISNHSRGNISFTVDIEIAYEEDVENAIEVMKEVCIKFEEEYEDDITEKPEVLGIKSFNASGVTITIIGKAKPLSNWKLERALRKELKLALDNEGIEIPYPKTEIIKNN